MSSSYAMSRFCNDHIRNASQRSRPNKKSKILPTCAIIPEFTQLWCSMNAVWPPLIKSMCCFNCRIQSRCHIVSRRDDLKKCIKSLMIFCNNSMFYWQILDAYEFTGPNAPKRPTWRLITIPSYRLLAMPVKAVGLNNSHHEMAHSTTPTNTSVTWHWHGFVIAPCI